MSEHPEPGKLRLADEYFPPREEWFAEARAGQLAEGVTTDGEYCHRLYRYKDSGYEIETVSQGVDEFGRLIVCCQHAPAPLGYYETAEALDEHYELIGRYIKAYHVPGDD